MKRYKNKENYGKERGYMKLIFLTIVSLFLITIASASSQSIAVIPLDGLGNLQPSTSFEYVFSYTTNPDCSGVLFNYSENITTNSNGLAVINVNTTDLSSIASYICEYRNGTLRRIHNATDQFFNNVFAQKVNATYLFGDGSGLTNVDVSAINITVPTCTGDDVLAYNGTDLNCIAQTGGSGDNSSWNETYADTLYILNSNEGNLNVNSSDYWDEYDTANTTWFQNIAGVLSLKLSQLTSWADTWLGTKTTDNLGQGSINFYDNRSWNQTLANTLYATIGGSGDNSSWNETYARTIFFDEESDLTTLLNDNYAPINYGDDWNKTYADTLYADISVTGGNESWNESYANTIYAPIGTTGDNSSFNQSLTDSLYAGIEWDYNQTEEAENLLNGTGLILNWSNIISSGSDNSSWNETYADTKYLQSYTETDPNWEGNSTLVVYTSDTSNWDKNISDDFTSLDNFTGTLTNEKICTYNSGTGKIDCDYTDQTGAGGNTKSGGLPYLYNDTDNIYLNETKLNQTIELLDSDTTYSDLSEFNNDVGFVTNDTVNKTVDCSDIVGSDADFCVDASGSGGNTTEEMQDAIGNGLNNTLTYYDDDNEIGVNKTWLDSIYATLTSLADYVLTSDLVSLVGNWSADKEDYYTSSQVDSLGNYSGENSTIARIGDCPSGQFVQNTTTGGVECLAPTLSESDPLWSANQSSYSTTADILAFGYYNSTNFVITDYFTKSDILGFNYYNSTDFDIADYSTTSEMNTSIENANTSMKNYVDGEISGISLEDTNCSVDDSCDLITYDSELDYYTDADIDGSETAFDGWDKDASDDITQTYGNATYIKQENEANLNVNSSDYWDDLDSPLDSWTSTYNATYDSYNSTGLIKDWNSTGLILNWSNIISSGNNIIDDSLYNSTELEEQGDGNLGIIDSFINLLVTNQVTQAFIKALGFYDNTEVYNKTEIESFNYYNSTNPQPDSNYTEDEIEAFIFDNDNTNNLNMSSYNITMDGGVMYSNSSCLKIKGETSLLEIC